MERKVPRRCERCGLAFLAPSRPGRPRMGRYCSRSCANKSQVPRPVSHLERFLRGFVRSAEPEGCWPWLYTRNAQGYGRFVLYPSQGKSFIAAHRAAYLLFRGPIAPGLFVLHRCDSPPCVRPSHLFLGTQKDNMDDAHAKGRDRRVCGDEHGSRKINYVAAEAIRRDYAAGGVTQEALAREHGLSPSAVRAIVHGKTWKRRNSEDRS